MITKITLEGIERKEEKESDLKGIGRKEGNV